MKASKYRRKNSSKRTRKNRGGGGMGVNITSGSEYRDTNPSRGSLCPGCRSDNTTGAGAYSLNTPLPDNRLSSLNKGPMVGGTRALLVGGGKSINKRRGKKGGSFTCGGCGQLCTKPPLQFLQSGGGGKGKGSRGKAKKSRKLGGGGFWDFAKPFWNPSNPSAVGYENGYKVLAPSCKGISPSGLGSPVSTSGYEPTTKPWSAEFRNDKHLYQKGGGHKKNSRKLKGGNIINDIFDFGRTAAYGIGTTFNNFMGVSNDIYTSPPNPLFGQFPRGYGDGKIIGGEKQFMDIKAHDIKNIYKNATYTASKV
jgi:hypothetical protein